ncbi:MAG: hypothetical protein ACLQVI_20075 [Polyangiaceae bacterium]|jgi:hypothetical protein
MSKIDQLRRQREEQHERQEQQAGTPAAKSARIVTSAPVLAARHVKSAGDDLEGKCSVCGKVRALQNGLVTSHQKGLGKMCPGSRKEPAPG